MKLPHLSALLVISLLSAPVAAQQPPELWDRVGNWDIFAEHTPDGAFDVCTAMRVFENGEALVFFFNRETTTMGFFLENWQLDQRETYEVAIQVDEGERIPATATATEDRKAIMLNLELSGSILEMAKGETLYLHTGAGALKFDLAGMDPAVYGMALCALENTGEDIRGEEEGDGE